MNDDSSSSSDDDFNNRMFGSIVKLPMSTYEIVKKEQSQQENKAMLQNRNKTKIPIIRKQ